jgi:hypothetical protein
MTATQQQFGQMRTNETIGTGDENFVHDGSFRRN